MQNKILENNLKAMGKYLPGLVLVLRKKIEEFEKEEKFLIEKEKQSRQNNENNEEEKKLEEIENKQEINSEEDNDIIQEIDDIEAEYAQDESIIFRVEMNGKKQYLNGRYAPQKRVDEWYEKIGRVNYMSSFTMFGIGSGLYLKKVIEETDPLVQILVFEPSLKIFISLLECVDLQEVLENRAIGFIIGTINEDEFQGILSRILSYQNMTVYHNLIHPGYDKLYPKEILKYGEKIKTYIGKIRVYWNTTIRYLNGISKNALNNCCYIPYHYKARQLADKIPVDIPAIIVSAGPSLNKNIKQLKKAKGKAFIIATDTAVKPMLKAGIQPDVFVIVDGLKPRHLFEIEGISDIPVVTPMSSATEVLSYHKGKKFFFGDGYPMAHFLYALGGNCLEGLETGGSVANNAFSLAYKLGMTTIILVGQDLAMTNGYSHADNTFQEKMQKLDLTGLEYREVEGIDGKTVITRVDFLMYLKWFEDQIKTKTDITVIDATEGGAKIHGTTIMTLKDAIKKTCIKKVDIQKIIEDIPPLFNEKQRKTLVRYMTSADKKIMNVQKKANQGIRLYNRLEKLCKKRVFPEKEYIEVIEKIRKITLYMENEPLALTLIESLKGVDFVLSEGIYEVEEDIKKEGIVVARQGRYMLECISMAVNEMAEILKDTIGTVEEKKEQYMERKNNTSIKN